jgi:hypothetical protein
MKSSGGARLPKKTLRRYQGTENAVPLSMPGPVFPQNQAVADRDRRDPNEAGDERHERSQNCGKPVPAQSAGASPASLAGKGGRDAGAAGRDARALAEAQPQVARGEVAPARASSMIRRMVRAQRPHSALHPKHR